MGSCRGRSTSSPATLSVRPRASCKGRCASTLDEVNVLAKMSHCIADPTSGRLTPWPCLWKCTMIPSEPLRLPVAILALIRSGRSLFSSAHAMSSRAVCNAPRCCLWYRIGLRRCTKAAANDDATYSVLPLLMRLCGSANRRRRTGGGVAKLNSTDR